MKQKTLEGQPADGLVVGFVHDIHWGEPAFLHLLEHVRDNAVDSPILLLATARHDLLDEHPNWGEGERSVRLVLKPLNADAAAQVVANLLGSADLAGVVLARIVSAAEGNPLYVEQMLSMLIDTGALKQEAGRWVRANISPDIVVPPTIQALLEARLDKLGREERATLEPASIVGLEFRGLERAERNPAACRSSASPPSRTRFLPDPRLP